MESNSSNVEEVVVKKNSNKLVLLVIVSVVAICSILCGVVYYATAGSPSAKLQKQLDLGNKYLDEMDYEHAIVAFEEAISIDPKSEEAYMGLADTYIAMAKQAIADNDIDLAQKYYKAAIDVLQKGVEETGSTQLEDYLDEIKEKYDDLGEDPDNEKEQSDIGEGGMAADGSMSEDDFVAFLIENEELDTRCMQTSISGHTCGFIDRYATRAAYENNYGPVIADVENYIMVIKANKQYVPDDSEIFNPEYSGTAYYGYIDDTNVYIHSLSCMYEKLSLMYLYEGDLENCLRIRTEWAEFAGRPDLIQDGNQGFNRQEDLDEDKYGRELSALDSMYVYNDSQIGALSEHEENDYSVVDKTYIYDSEGRISEVHVIGVFLDEPYEEYIIYSYSGNSVTRTTYKGEESFIYEFELDEHCKEIYK